MNDAAPALSLEGIERRYGRGETTIEVLSGADLALWPGQSVALIAPSGAGKSTLLHLAGLLEKPDGGEVYVGGAATAAMSDDKRTALRRVEIGFVYQFHHLLPEFSAFENIVLPQMIRGLARAEAASPRARTARLSRPCAHAKTTARRSSRAASSSASPSPEPSPTRRACCWRTSPPAISTPRPPTTCSATLTELVKASRVAALVATHNLDLAARMDRRVTLREGRVVEMA